MPFSAHHLQVSDYCYNDIQLKMLLLIFHLLTLRLFICPYYFSNGKFIKGFYHIVFILKKYII